MKAVLLYYQKVSFQGRYLMEMTIHQVGRSFKYPEGIKYGLLLLDRRTGKRVLMDNHHPKGHHYHLDYTEFSYEYTTDGQLIEDFKRLAYDHLGVSL